MADIHNLDDYRNRRQPTVKVRSMLDSPLYMNVSASHQLSLDAECNLIAHWFDAVPGPCKCGHNYWNPDNTITKGA